MALQPATVTKTKTTAVENCMFTFINLVKHKLAVGSTDLINLNNGLAYIRFAEMIFNNSW